MEMNKQTNFHNQKLKGGSKNMEKMYTMLLIAFLVVGTLPLALADTSVNSVEASEPGFFKNAWNKFKATFGFKETKQANLANKIAQLKDVGASEKAINAAQINYNKLNTKFTAVKVNGASPTNPLEKPLFSEESFFNSEDWRDLHYRIENSNLTDKQKAEIWKRFWNALYGLGDDSDDSGELTTDWRAIINRFKNASPSLSDSQRNEIAQRIRGALFGQGNSNVNVDVSYEDLEAELIQLQSSNGNGIDISRWRSIYNRIVNSGFSDERIVSLLNRFYNALEGHGYHFDFDNDNDVKPIKLTPSSITKVANQNVVFAQ